MYFPWERSQFSLRIRYQSKVVFKLFRNEREAIIELLAFGNLSPLPWPVVSTLDATFTVSPNKQNRGMWIPTTPATQEPGNNKK